MQFRCRLASADGEILEGVYTGENEAELRQSLEGKGYHILSLRKRAGFKWSGLALAKRRRLSDRAFIVFNQELAALLHSGMPLVQSLEILKERVDEPVLSGVLAAVHQRVREGISLAEAFEECDELFLAFMSRPSWRERRAEPWKMCCDGMLDTQRLLIVLREERFRPWCIQEFFSDCHCALLELLCFE